MSLSIHFSFLNFKKKKSSQPVEPGNHLWDLIFIPFVSPFDTLKHYCNKYEDMAHTF